MVGCASGPATSIDSGRILDHSLVQEGEGLIEITFVRDRLFLGSGLRLRLFSDGRPFADLKTGEEINIFVNPGIHHFSVLRQPIFLGDRTPHEVTAEIYPNRRYEFRVTFDQVGETIIPSNFYALEQSPSHLTIEQTLSLIKIGSGTEEVMRLLGRPNSTSFKITSSGRAVIWAYSYGTLVERIQGGGAAFGYGFSQEMNGQRADKMIYLTFMDGSLGEIDGN